MRTPARVVALASTFVVMFVVGTGSAFAEQPVGPAWPNEEDPRSTLELLLFFGGGTIVLFVLVALFGLLTARNNYVPPAPSTEVEKAPDHTPAHH